MRRGTLLRPCAFAFEEQIFDAAAFQRRDHGVAHLAVRYFDPFAGVGIAQSILRKRVCAATRIYSRSAIAPSTERPLAEAIFRFDGGGFAG
jgi:hypothetical protein